MSMILASNVRLPRPQVIVQLLRYLIVACFAFAVDFLLLVAGVEWLRLHLYVSAAVGFCGGVAVNYALCALWVFHERAFSDRRIELALFTTIGIVGLWITELVLVVGEALVVDYRLSKLVAVAIVLVWNFGMRRRLLFTAPRTA